MNNTIIKKCLDELQKESFRKDYVIGMLETLYEMSEKTQPRAEFAQPKVYNVEVPTSDEGQVLDLAAKAKLSEVMKNIKYE